MSRHALSCAALALCCGLGLCHAQTLHWYLEPEVQWGNAEAGEPVLDRRAPIAVDASNVYVYASAFINLYRKDGTFVRSIENSNVGRSRTWALAANGSHVFVFNPLSQAMTELKAFSPDGRVAWTLTSGSLLGFVSDSAQYNTLGLCSAAGRLYARNHTKLHVLTATGSYLKEFSLYTQNSNVKAHCVDTERLYVGYYTPHDGWVSVLSHMGLVLDKWPLGTEPLALAASDKYIFVFHEGNGSDTHVLSVFDKSGALVARDASIPVNYAYAWEDELYVMGYWGGDYRISTLSGPHYRTLGTATPNALPYAHGSSIAQREGTLRLDVDYTTEDPDTPTLTVYAGAFAASRNDDPTLNDFVPMRSFVDGTSSNVGPGIATGQTHRLTWDMGADGMDQKLGDHGTLHVKVMARDDRGLMDFHFLTIPAMGPDPSFEINRVPVTGDELLPCWFWLLASGDAELSLTTGCVSAVSGDFSGQLLARGTNTMDAGRAFLFQRMGVRKATTNELRIAREASTPGSVTEWEPRRMPPVADAAVNEFNFVTSPTNGWWVVPSP